MKQKDWVLITWIICAFVWAIFLLAGTSYLVFFKGISEWWFLLAIFCAIQITLFKSLGKRYGVEND